MAKQQFYIPICVDNLAQYFAFGFITPACVFPFKNHMPDEFSLQPQRIPLHSKPSAANKIPRAGLQRSRDEDENLKSALVIVSLDVSKLEKSEGSQWFYLSDLLPIYLISEIIFQDEDAFEHFEYLTNITGRVSKDLCDSIKYRKLGFEKLFQTDVSVCLSDVDNYRAPLKFDKHSLLKMSGYGAALALSYVMAKNAEVANDAFKALASLGTLLFSSYQNIV